MTQDITRWLTEIRTLQQQLAASRQERDQAYKSASNWRQLYDAEAKQRRDEVEQLQLTVNSLRAELQALQSQVAQAPVIELEQALATESDLNTVEGLRTELVKALQQCDRLQKALNSERQEHAETRQALTTALGEAIEALAPNQSALIHPSTGSELQAPDSTAS
ncbi:MAG: hypothetical protein AAFX01_06155 [Cyanobacteria bacterium J06638_28]